MKTTMQDRMGGITDTMKRADLYRQGDVGQMYAAQGGRIGYANGSADMNAKVKYLREMGASDEEIYEIIVLGKDMSDQYKILDRFEGVDKERPGPDWDRDPGFTRPTPDWDRDPGFIRPTPDWDRDPGFTRPPRPRRRLEEIEGRLEPMAQGGRIGYASGSGRPPVTMGQPIQAPQPMPGPQAPQTPMPAPQPNRMGGMNPMMGGMNPMARGMNPMMNRPMMGGMNPMMGGRRMAQEGGLMNLGGMEKDYRQEGGFVPLGGKEKADDVPARLSKNEFVFTADAVRGAGGGDIDRGAEIMENIMKNLEQGGQISEETQGLGGAQEMFDVSERLSEVV